MKLEEEISHFNESLNFLHGEVDEIKRSIANGDKEMNGIKERVAEIDQDRNRMNETIIDLQTRSMRDNLIFYNITEQEHENTTDRIHSLLEEKFGIANAKERVA